MGIDRFDELLLDLYGCASDPGLWSRVLDRICDEMQVRSAVVQRLVLDEERTWSRWMVRDSESEAARDIHDRYFADACNPRMLRKPVTRPMRMVVRDSDLFAPSDPLQVDLKERLAALRLGTFCSVNLPLANQERIALVLHRDLSHDCDFGPDEEDFAIRLLPHLRQAVQLGSTAHAAAERARDLHAAMDSIRCALVLCVPGGRVCWANRAAEKIFAQRDRVWLSGERLTASSVQETARLRQVIDQAAHEHTCDQHTAGQIAVIGRHSSRGAVQVKAQRLAHSTRQAGLSANDKDLRVLLILAEAGAAPVLPPDLVSRLFGLSPAEARLAAALCLGTSVNDYAAEHGVTVGTARYQLKQVMAKTAVARQSDLVQLMCSSVIAQTLPSGG